MTLISKDYTGWILMAVAAILGLGAFLLINRYLGEEQERFKREALQSRGKFGAVVVARSSLPAGSVIGKSTMSVGEMPFRHISARMVLPADFSQVENRVLNRPMSPGEPLIADFVSGLVVNRFSELLAEGTRAISVEVSALESHSGMLIPGDYIDLFAQLPLKDSREKRLVGLYERVKVLAAGPSPLRAPDQSFQPLTGNAQTYNLITVALPAADAEDILRAREQGDIVYLLRGANDHALGFPDSGIPMFSQRAFDQVTQADGSGDGYIYYSASVPKGERRLRHDGDDPSEAHADFHSENATLPVGETPASLDRVYLEKLIHASAQPREAAADGRRRQ